ncbi:hypothetical protein D3C76_166360 [compost metagenome]
MIRKQLREPERIIKRSRWRRKASSAGLIQRTVGQNHFTSCCTQFFMLIHIGNHRLKSIALHNRIRVKQQHVPPPRHSHRLIVRLREARIFLICDQMYIRKLCSNRLYRIIRRCIVHDNNLVAISSCRIHNRPQTIHR